MMKRYLAIFLALCMMLSLVACTGSVVSEEPVEEPVPVTGLDAIHAALTIEEGEEYDFGSHLPLVKEGEDNHLTIGLIVNANTTDYDNNAYTQWLEETTGIDLEFVQFAGTSSDAATQLSLMMAAGETLPDIVLRFTGVAKSQGAEYGRDGYFADLSAYFADPELNYYRKWALEKIFPDEMDINDMLMLRTTDDSGAIYAYPRLENCPEDRPKYHVSINKAWLEAVGMEAPTTVEELYDVLVAFRDQDPNGNGLPDEIPMIGLSSGNWRDIVSWIINAFVFTNDTYYFNVKDGQLWNPYVTDAYRDALKFISKLVKEGLLSPQTWTISTTELKALQNPNEGEPYLVGVIASNVYNDIPNTSTAMQDYIQLPPLKDAGYGLGGYGPMLYCTMEYNTFITADCKNPELAFRLLDFLCSPENHLRMDWGVEGQDWVYSDGTKPGNLGGTATFKLLNEKVNNTPNNIVWHNYAGVSSSLYFQREIDLSDPNAYESVRYNRDQTLLKYYDEAGLPEEVFYFNVYTDEEVERRDEISVNDMTDYMRHARAEFCSGVLDPNSDADWNAYLKALENMHEPEWMEIGQAAYDRVFKK